MKITTFILFLAIMQVSATTLAQKVSLKANNQPLSAIFDQISSQTGYDFAYTTKTLESAKPVTINVKNEELSDVLQKIFENQPLEFTIKDKFVSVTVKQPGILDKIKSALNLDKIDVTGRVVDENNQPLPGATIIVKGTNNSTITDAKGIFTLKKVDPNGTLVITFIGYDKKELPIATDLGTIKLTPATGKLDEVNVIAYGQTTQRLTVGNIATVSAKEIEEQPVSNPLLALEGRVPGLFITQSSGLPGSPVSVQIQGQNSIKNGNDPFYVIDGIPYASELLTTTAAPGISPLSNGYLNGGSGPFSFINPDDIESIAILKDAAATAIYGSRAANGAILITTKKGKAGDTKVNFNLQQGYGQIAHFLDLLNTQQYLEMRHEGFKNDGTTPGQYDVDVNGLWDTTRYTNWQKVLIGGTAKYEDYNGSVSGGTENTQFLVSGTLHRETTVFPGDFADIKGSVHFNFNNTSTNKKFHLNLSGSYLVDNNQLPQLDLTQSAITLAPDAPALRNLDGSLNWEPDATLGGFETWTNPLAFEYNTYQLKTNNLASSMLLSYELLPGLNIKTAFGYNNMQNNEFVANPLSADPPSQRPTTTSGATYSNSAISSWDIEPQLTYKKTMGRGTLDALLGATLTDQSGNGNVLGGYGYNSDASLADIRSASGVYVINSVASIYKYEALFGRLNYNWGSKYIFDLTARRDGSSRFGPENEYHNFWSAGGAWIFSEETWIKNNLSFLSFAKLRGSYGTTGNDQIGNYQYLNLFNSLSYFVPYQGIGGLAPSGLNNPYLQWEETRKLQFGLDLGFLKDRILLSANYVRNRSSNELLSTPLPIITGFSSIAANLPATVQNTSWEFTLNTINAKSTNFRWSTGFNLTIPQNKLVSFPGLAESSYSNLLVIGQPVNIIQAYHYIGVNPSTGLYQFASSSGPTSNPNFLTDRTEFINTNPKFYGGFQNSFAYRRFHLDVLLSFVKQLGSSNSINYSTGVLPGQNQNQLVSVLDRWQNPGDVKPIQQFSAGSNFSVSDALSYLQGSNAAYPDASYIRLKNLALSYQLPDAWVKKALIQSFSLYLQAQNLLTITKFTGLDPENPNGISIPPLRIITLGIKVGL